jgi:hypothetical protein
VHRSVYGGSRPALRVAAKAFRRAHPTKKIKMAQSNHSLYFEYIIVFTELGTTKRESANTDVILQYFFNISFLLGRILVTNKITEKANGIDHFFSVKTDSSDG